MTEIIGSAFAIPDSTFQLISINRGRWFTPWLRPRHFEEHYLPDMIRLVTGQETVPFGDVVLATRDTVMAPEICEELFTPNSPHVHLGLDGVEIFTNGSASHHELRKLQRRVDLMRSATSKIGGAYLYANQQGCDGERAYYDGCALISCNGHILAQGSQFSLDDIEVVTASVSLDDIRSRRGSVISRGMQASLAPSYHRVHLGITLSDPLRFEITRPIFPLFHSVEEEIEYVHCRLIVLTECLIDWGQRAGFGIICAALA